ncbi:MAG: YbaB/EbfC family nucleoid-associated protein [Gaiellaceae bacterium]
MKGMDLNKLMQQAAQMQEQMAKAQEELANEVVDGSAGGVVTVKVTGAGRLIEVSIAPEAIDPEDPEVLGDLIVAAVNNALDAVQARAESKMGGMMPDLGGLFPGA